jgi:hypothetical protein
MFHFQKTCKEIRKGTSKKKETYSIFSLSDEVLNISVSEHLNSDEYFQHTENTTLNRTQRLRKYRKLYMHAY